MRAAREAQGLSASALAERSGVSRAMIAKIERAEAQPTAALLGRLSGALGLTLSELVARAEHADRRLARAAEQPTWTDPDSGYTRRALSPAAAGRSSSSRSTLPGRAPRSPIRPTPTRSSTSRSGCSTARCASSRATTVHELAPGDCLQLGPPRRLRVQQPGAAAVPLPGGAALGGRVVGERVVRQVWMLAGLGEVVACGSGPAPRRRPAPSAA